MRSFATFVAGAALALASCQSTLDAQVEGAIARARADESHRATTAQAEELARPAWWHGAPIAVPSATSRTFGAWCVHTPALASRLGAPQILIVSGPRGAVRLELERGAFTAADELAAWLSAADTSARVQAEAGDGALLAVVRVGAPASDGAYLVASGGTSSVAASAGAVVARCVWLDAANAADVADGASDASAASAGARRSTFELALAGDDPLSRAASSAILVCPRDTSPEAHDFAARAAFAFAMALADARASELDRHLVALDGEYSARLVGEDGARAVPAENLAWWHRDVRARLRTLALGGQAANIALEPPR